MNDSSPNGTAMPGYGNLLGQIKERIRSAQYEALGAVNKELIGLYWDIGRMLNDFFPLWGIWIGPGFNPLRGVYEDFH